MYIHALYVQLYVFIYINIYLCLCIYMCPIICFHIYKYISVLMYIHALYVQLYVFQIYICIYMHYMSNYMFSYI